MADRYWVSLVSADWDGTAGLKWATTSGGLGGASVPTSSDNVFFDANSGTETVTIAAGNTGCDNLDISAYGGSMANNADLTISGSYVNRASGGFSLGGGAFIFNSTGAETITMNGNESYVPVEFNGSGGSWTLQDDAFFSDTLTITQGTFDANNFNVWADKVLSNNSNTRTITMGSGTWTIGDSGTIWNTSTTTNLTLNANTSTIVATGTGARTITSGASALLNNVSITTDTGVFDVTANVNDLSFTSGFTGNWGTGATTIRGSLTMHANNGNTSNTATAATFSATSGTKTITTASNTINKPFVFNGVGGTWQLSDNLTMAATRSITLTNGTLDLNGKTVSTGTFDSNNANTRVLTFGAATLNLTFAAAGATIWDTTDQTNLTVNVNTGSIGVTGANASTRTIIQDSSPAVTIPSITVSAGSGGVTTQGLQTTDLTFTSGYTGSWLNGGTTLLGSLSINAANGAPSASASTLTFAATSGTKTLTSGGKTLDFPIAFDGVGGTFSLSDALTVGSSRTVTLTNGTFTANNQTVSMGAFSSSNANTRALTMGSGTWSLTGTGTVWDLGTTTGLTLTEGTSTIKLTNNSASSKTFAGGGETYNNYWNATAGAGVTIMTGSNTFNDLKIDAARTQQFTAATTTTVTTFTATGTAGNLITITSPTSAQHTLTKSGGGTITCDYLNLSYSNATPGSTWTAGNHSVIGASVTGWILPATGGSKALLFT